jgi:hypothetical protein
MMLQIHDCFRSFAEFPHINLHIQQNLIYWKQISFVYYLLKQVQKNGFAQMWDFNFFTPSSLSSNMVNNNQSAKTIEFFRKQLGEK